MVNSVVETRSRLPTRFLVFNLAFHKKTPISVRVSEGFHFLFEQLHVLTIVSQIAGGSSTCPVLQTLTHYWLVVLVIGISKSGRLPLELCIFAHYRLDWVHLVLIIDEAWIMLLLWHLCKVASPAKAHRNLSVVTPLVLVHRLYIFKCLSIDASEHLFVAIVDWVDLVGASILHWKRFFQSRDARWNAKLLLAAHNS